MSLAAMVEADERIVKVCSKVRGTFYAIRDVVACCWRSTEPMDGLAWTRDLGYRAQFPSRCEAAREMRAIRRWRREAACS